MPKERQIQWTLCALGGSLGRTSPAQGSREMPSDPFHQGFAQGFLSGKTLGGLGRPWAAQGNFRKKPWAALGRIFFDRIFFLLNTVIEDFWNTALGTRAAPDVVARSGWETQSTRAGGQDDGSYANSLK